MLDDYKLTKKTKEKPDIISSNPISQIKTNDIQREYHSQNAKTSHSANSNQNLFISVQENEEENQIKHLRLNTNEVLNFFIDGL